MFWGHFMFKTGEKLILKPFQSNGQVTNTIYLFNSISSLLSYLLIYLFICSCWACILSLHKLNVFIWYWTPPYCFPFEVLKFTANSKCLSQPFIIYSHAKVNHFYNSSSLPPSLVWPFKTRKAQTSGSVLQGFYHLLAISFYFGNFKRIISPFLQVFHFLISS